MSIKEGSLFEDTNLKKYGLEKFEDLSIYGEKKTNEEKLIIAGKRINKFEHMKLICPVCQNTISIKSVKNKYIRVLSKETDFRRVYTDPDPTIYNAWLCYKCGYAEMSNKFNLINNQQIKDVKKLISLNWKNQKIPLEYNIETAILKYKIVLINSTVKNIEFSEIANVCLMIAWLYRKNESVKNEKIFLKKAVNGFLLALEYENAPFSGMNEGTIKYLIGELYRRLGENSKALKWYTQAVESCDLNERVLLLAKNQAKKIYMY